MAKTREPLSPKDIPLVSEREKIVVVSDFHKYSGISTFSKDDEANKARRDEVFAEFKNADRVVFNGDIFDIECAKDPRASLGKAVDWLRKRLNEAPDTKFHFVLGNHENVEEFKAAMRTLEADYPNRFFFHEHALKLGDAMFVHGDEQVGIPKYVEAYAKSQEKTSPAPAPESWTQRTGDTADKDTDFILLDKTPQTEGRRQRTLKDIIGGDTTAKHVLARTAYEWFEGSYKAVENKLWRHPHRMVKTLHDSLSASRLPGVKEMFEECTHVFSGHTHEPYDNLTYHGRVYGNSGATVALATFGGLRFTLQNGKVEGKAEPVLEKDRALRADRKPEHLGDQVPDKVFCTSDLHLYASVSRAMTDGAFDANRLDGKPPEIEREKQQLRYQLRKAIRGAMDDADIIILNGDIFELFYTKDQEAAKAGALGLLKIWANKYPDKEIYFNLGNHEAITDFIAGVKEIEKTFPNFHFNERGVLLRDKLLVLHGDEVTTDTDTLANTADLFQFMFTKKIRGKPKERDVKTPEEAKESGEPLHLALNHYLELPVMMAANRLRPIPDIIRQVSQCIEKLDWLTEEQKANITEVLIGHTHQRFLRRMGEDGRGYGNTGTAANHGEYGGMTFDLYDDGTTANRSPLKVHHRDMGVVPNR